MKHTYFKPLAALFVLAFLLLSNACKKDPVVIDDDDPAGGKIKFTFAHHVDGQPAIYDTTMYINAAGNHYQVNQVQYFISDVTLHKTGGTKVTFKPNNDIYYVDKDISSTLTWSLPDDIPAGSYDSISFTLGISEAKNQSFMFVNPPEVDMWWPVELGGGYHYMKLNMKWITASSLLSSNIFHLGIGQLRDGNGNITGFVQNYFTIKLPNSSFTIVAGETITVPVIMNIENWFKNPNLYDFDYWGADIMENQDAIATACENGHDVFTTGTISK